MEQHKTENFTPQVRTIFRGTGKPKGLFTQTAQTKRVAAYCRVSTSFDTQALSLETQMTTFRQKIMEHPGWVLADVYSDEGLSGTSVRKRPAFMRMVADCKAGRIDYIITKSISRFARNTQECLEYVRLLQSYGTQILFEKEGVDTASATSELIMTILAAVAQEESHSISENVKWGVRKRFERGVTRWCPCYGFSRDGRDKLVINPEEAKVVRRMFDMYEHGASLQEIADALNDDGIPSPRGKTWVAFNVGEVLDNEKHKGDALLQKYLSVDHLSHRSIKNDATEVSSYYVTGHHKAIVSEKTFDRVQKIRGMKSNLDGHIPQYPYGEMELRCPLCGAPLVQRNTRGNYKNRLALGCFTGQGCGKFALRKNMVSDALIEAYNNMNADEIGDDEPFLMMKRKHPTMDTVEFYWLDELVERIEVAEHIGPMPWKSRSPVSCWDVIVRWRCGLVSTVPINLRSVGNEPALVAEQFWVNEQKYRQTKAKEGEKQ